MEFQGQSIINEGEIKKLYSTNVPPVTLNFEYDEPLLTLKQTAINNSCEIKSFQTRDQFSCFYELILISGGIQLHSSQVWKGDSTELRRKKLVRDREYAVFNHEGGSSVTGRATCKIAFDTRWEYQI